MIRLFQIATLIFALLLAGCLPAEDDGKATETQTEDQSGADTGGDETELDCPLIDEKELQACRPPF